MWGHLLNTFFAGAIALSKPRYLKGVIVLRGACLLQEGGIILTMLREDQELKHLWAESCGAIFWTWRCCSLLCGL